MPDLRAEQDPVRGHPSEDPDSDPACGADLAEALQADPVEILPVHRAWADRSSQDVVHGMVDTFAVCEASDPPGRPVLPALVDRSYGADRSTDLDPGTGEDLAVGGHFRDASEGPVAVEGLPVQVVLACASDPASDGCAEVAFPVAFRVHPFPSGVALAVRWGHLVHRVVLPEVPFPCPFRPCPVPAVAVR